MLSKYIMYKSTYRCCIVDIKCISYKRVFLQIKVLCRIENAGISVQIGPCGASVGPSLRRIRSQARGGRAYRCLPMGGGRRGSLGAFYSGQKLLNASQSLPPPPREGWMGHFVFPTFLLQTHKKINQSCNGSKIGIPKAENKKRCKKNGGNGCAHNVVNPPPKKPSNCILTLT